MSIGAFIPPLCRVLLVAAAAFGPMMAQPPRNTHAKSSQPLVQYWVAALDKIDTSPEDLLGLYNAIQSLAPGHTKYSGAATAVGQACHTNPGTGNPMPNCEVLIFYMKDDPTNPGSPILTLFIEEKGDVPQKFYSGGCGRHQPFANCLEPLQDEIARKLWDHAQLCHKPGGSCVYNPRSGEFEPRQP